MLVKHCRSYGDTVMLAESLYVDNVNTAVEKGSQYMGKPSHISSDF